MMSSTDPTVQRLLGQSGGFGQMLGLDNRWMANAIKASGNWMWPAKLPGEGAKMYACCEALSEALCQVGVVPSAPFLRPSRGQPGRGQLDAAAGAPA
jgi:hypothetical protein